MVGPGQKGILRPAGEGLSRGRGKVTSAHLLGRSVHIAALGSSPTCVIRGGMVSLAPDLLTRALYVGEFFTNPVPGGSATCFYMLLCQMAASCRNWSILRLKVTMYFKVTVIN